MCEAARRRLREDRRQGSALGKLVLVIKLLEQLRQQFARRLLVATTLDAMLALARKLGRQIGPGLR